LASVGLSIMGAILSAIGGFSIGLASAIGGYYLPGALFLIVGLMVSVYGGKKKTSPESMVTTTPEATVPTTTQRFCSRCGNRLRIDDKFCSICGQAIS
jgi:hypothetical protein